MKLLQKALLFAALGAAALSRLAAQVAAPTPSSIEGTISEIAVYSAGETIMTVMGVNVLIPASLETDQLIITEQIPDSRPVAVRDDPARPLGPRFPPGHRDHHGHLGPRKQPHGG